VQVSGGETTWYEESLAGNASRARTADPGGRAGQSRGEPGHLPGRRNVRKGVGPGRPGLEERTNPAPKGDPCMRACTPRARMAARPAVGSNEGSQMPRHLISDAHEWINEILTVPTYTPAKPQPRERAWRNRRGKKTLLSLTLVGRRETARTNVA
jgi:hypothetical protein